MKILLIEKLINEKEWIELMDKLWNNPELFFSLTEFKLIEEEVKNLFENRDIVAYNNQDYIIHKAFDIKDNLQGYIFLNFQAAFFMNKDKEGFCSGCTSTDLFSSGDVPYGELSNKQLDLIKDRENTTYCGKCYRIMTPRKEQNTSIVVSPTRKRRLKKNV